MTKINELIVDFKLNQEILDRVKRYVDLCMYRLNRWERFTAKEVTLLGDLLVSNESFGFP